MDRLCAYLDGRLSPEKQQELRTRLEQDPELRRELAELVYQRRLLVELGTEQEHATDIAKFTQGTRARRRAAAPRRRFRFAWIAVAACLVAAIAIPVAYRYMNPPAPTSLEALARAAANARTVADLRALAAPCRTLYDAEAATQDDSSLLTLVHLGLSTAITSNPKEDRQTEDLRFVLDQAVRTHRISVVSDEWLDLMPAAEAAVSRLPAGDTFTIREHYSSARAAARLRYYDHWHQDIIKAARLSTEKQSEAVAPWMALELSYVNFYERGMALDVQQRLDTIPSGTKLAAPLHYLATSLKPIVDAAAERERRLLTSLDYSKTETHGKGKWKAEVPSSAEKQGIGQWYTVVSQTFTTSDDTLFLFNAPPFEEAVVTGQLKVLGLNASEVETTDLLWGAGIFFKKGNTVKWHMNASAVGMYSSWDMKNRWCWFRHHYSHLGGGRWRLTQWRWIEGHQPHDIRWADESTLPEPTTIREVKPESRWTAFTQTVEDYPDTPAVLGLKTIKCGVEWRGLGIEVIRPTDDAAILYETDFENGLKDWKASIFDRPDAKAAHMSMATVERNGSPTKVLRVDCRGFRNTLLTAVLERPIRSRGIVFECDMMSDKSYEKRWYYELSVLMPKDNAKLEEKFRSAEGHKRPGVWWKYRREHYVVREGSEYATHARSYVDGKLNSHVIVRSSHNPENQWVIWLGVKHARMHIDNLVIKEFSP